MNLKNRYSRITISAVLVVICIGLVSLGIRLPSLTGVSSSQKPKPRPRAIIQTQIKTCKEKICLQAFDAVPVMIFAYAPLWHPQPLELAEYYTCSNFNLVGNVSPRAPPVNS